MANIDKTNLSDYKQIATTDIALAKTDIGKLLYENNIFIEDISMTEPLIKKNYIKYKKEHNTIVDGNSILNALYRIFLLPIYKDTMFSQSWTFSLYASENKRIVYAQIIDEKAKNEKLGSIVGKTVGSWENRIGEPIYVGSMGNVDKIGNKTSQNLNYHIFSNEEKALMPSYALALIKENLDNVENYILPFIEVMYSLKLINEDYYKEIKYGTSNDNIIALIRMGFDISIAKIISEDHELMKIIEAYVAGDTFTSRGKILDALRTKHISRMALNAAESVI